MANVAITSSSLRKPNISRALISLRAKFCPLTTVHDVVSKGVTSQRELRDCASDTAIVSGPFTKELHACIPVLLYNIMAL